MTLEHIISTTHRDREIRYCDLDVLSGVNSRRVHVQEWMDER